MNQEKPFEEQRQHQRYPLMLAAEIGVSEDDDWTRCVVFDISDGGAKVRLNEDDDAPATAIETDSTVTLDVPLCADFSGTVVWTDDAYLGIRFTDPDAADVKRVIEVSGRDAA